jgi:hypothetical protein
MILYCGCKASPMKGGAYGGGFTNGAEFQDKTYGKGYRVCTGPKGTADKKKDSVTYTCTVCGSEVKKSSPASTEKVVKKKEAKNKAFTIDDKAKKKK